MSLRPLATLSLLLGALLAGCGPSGKLATHNPTDEIVTVKVGAMEQTLAPGTSAVLGWRGSPFLISVTDEDGNLVEEIEPAPEKGQRWLFHQVEGSRCFGIADFSNLYGAGTDGALDGVDSLQAASWSVLPRKMDFWPGQKMPIYIEQEEVWGMVEVPCGMTVDDANTHAAIHAKIDDLKPK